MDLNMVYWIGGTVLLLIVLTIIRRKKREQRIIREFYRQMDIARSKGEDVVHWDPSCVG